MSEEFQQPQTPFDPQNTDDLPPKGQLSFESLQQIKSAQTLITVATIGAPVSLFVGGVLLSVVSIICAVLGYTKLKKVSLVNGMTHPLVSKVIRSAVLAGCFGIGALVLNGLSMAMLMPAVMDYVNNGNADALNGILGGQAMDSSSGKSSVWG